MAEHQKRRAKKRTKRYAVFSGYSKRAYVRILRGEMDKKGIQLVCAYERKPITPTKKEYLELFDLTLNLKDPDGLKKLAALKGKVELVTCTQERDMSTHLLVLETLGEIDAEQAELYKALTHKHLLKEKLREVASAYAPRSIRLSDTSLNDVDKDFFPCVIKPSGLAGSSFVFVAKTRRKALRFLKRHQNQMLGNGTEFYNRKSEIIAEEFIAEPQYSVNAYVNKKGEITYCPLMRVIPAYEIGLNDTYSAVQYTTHELSDEKLSSLHAAVEEIVSVFKIKNTSVHFDAVYGKDSWKFFEIGLRIGGHREKTYDLSHGFSHFKNDILNRLGEEPDLGEEKVHVAVVQKASLKTGILKKITYVRRVKEEKSPKIQEAKLAKLHNEVLPVSLGGGTITRHFVLGKEEDRVLEASHTLLKSIKFKVR